MSIENAVQTLLKILSVVDKIVDFALGLLKGYQK